MTNKLVVAALFVIQALCAAFFLYDIGVSLAGVTVPPINWQVYELIQIAAAMGLVFGAALTALVLRRSMQRSDRVESQLRAASGAFLELMEDRFREWSLTPAERDVAFLAIKGLSLQEISEIRQTSEGTVKAQTAAIYRKAGVSGRTQLLSLFIEDLILEELLDGRKEAGTVTN